MSPNSPHPNATTRAAHRDGRTAQVFSSFNKATVLRHFEWIRDYGIDGAMVQRFAHGLGNPQTLNHRDTVLLHCREAANRTGRSYALMYDLSGLPANRIDDVIADWKRLRDELPQNTSQKKAMETEMVRQ